MEIKCKKCDEIVNCDDDVVSATCGFCSMIDLYEEVEEDCLV